MNSSNEMVNVMIEAPVAQQHRPGGYIQRSVTMFRLTVSQADALARLKRGLAARGARLSSGRAVESSPQVLQWLLDEIGRGRADQFPESVQPEVPVVPVANDTPRTAALPGMDQIGKAGA